jgi:HlyD family secretion protein
MKRRILWIVLVLLLAGGLTGGYFYAQGVGSKPPFRTTPVTRGSVTAAVSATGTLNAVITVLVGSQVSGQVKELYADFNSQVKKGQVIARIDPEIFEAKVNQAKAQVDAAKAAVLNQQASVERARADLGNARAAQAVARAQTAKGQVSVVDTQRDLGRKRDLRIKGFIAQADEDAAQAVYDSSMAQHDANKAQEQAQEAGVRSAEAALKVTEAQLLSALAQVGQNEAGLRQTQLDLEHTIIRAPVDGVVVSRTVDVGQTVAASLQAPTLFTIAQDLTKMQVDTNVDEADVSRVKVGLRASFTVDSFPGQVFAGEIVQIRKAPQVVQNVVTYDVVVSAQNTDQKLLPGMTANVRIVTDRKEDALRVPNAALRFRPPGVEVDRTQRSGGGPGGGGPGGGGPGGGGRGAPGSGRGGGPGLPGRVFILAADGKPEAVQIRLGISDGTNTEVVEGPLTDKQEVIVGATTSPRPATAPPGPRL